MKLLVLSDSHSTLSFMRRCIQKLTPDYILHLGDYYEDGSVIGEEYPGIPLLQVPGNCDRYRCDPSLPLIRIADFWGVRVYFTHGHCHHVKQTLGSLLKDARENGADIVFFGHTHQSLCYQEDGLWVMNPGSCGYFGGSAGLVEIVDEKIRECRIMKDEDLI